MIGAQWSEEIDTIACVTSTSDVTYRLCEIATNVSTLYKA